MEFTGRLSALKHPYYRRYWSGSFASVGATQLQTMAQGWLLWELTGSAIYLGYLGAAASIPAIVMTLFGGVLADRLNKQKLMMITSSTVACLMAIQAWLDATGQVEAWHVILIASLVSFTAGFDWPTRQSIFPTLIDKDDMMSAVALNSIIWQSTRMVMPALGGMLIAAFDTWLVFALGSLGFVVMFFVVASLKLRPTERLSEGSTLQQMKTGLSFILHNQLFLVYFSITYASMFFGMAHNQLMPAFASLLEAGEQGYGLLISAGGIGSVVGTIVVGGLQGSTRLGWIILATATGSAVMILLFTLVTGFADLYAAAFPLALLCLTAGSVLSSMFGIASMTVLQLNVPDHLRGRVMGFYGITYSLGPLGGLLAGWLASYSSVPVAIAIGVGVYLTIVVAMGVTQVEIREIQGNAKY